MRIAGLEIPLATKPKVEQSAEMMTAQACWIEECGPKVLDMPRRQKSAPTSPPIGHRVSGLWSRDLGDRRAEQGDPG